MKKIITSIALAGVLATTGAALADNQADPVTPPPSESPAVNGGAIGGAAVGAVGGALVGGPVGAVIGGVAGAIGGGALGSLTDEDKVYIREYVVAHPQTEVTVVEPVEIGKPLPQTVNVYTFEGNPRVAGYRYTYINSQYYLVDKDGVVVGTIVE